MGVVNRTQLERVWQAAAVGSLCAVMVVPPAVAEGVGGGSLPVERHGKPLSQQERVRQALNRFTFGPRPGDVENVEKMGLQRWFEMELHPEQIDDSAFEAEMVQFPAMRLTVEQEMQRFPSGAAIRQLSRRDGELPGDPVERAIYGDALAVYEARLKEQAAEGQGAAGPVPAGQAAAAGEMQVSPLRAARSGRDDSALEGRGDSASGARGESAATGQAAGGDEMLAGSGKGKGGKRVAAIAAAAAPMAADEVEAVLRLGPGERFGRLVAMSPETMLGFRQSVRGRDRVRLMAGLSPEQREAVEAMVESPERVIVTEDQESRLMRDVDSRRQLQAVMTEFWLNHFNVYIHKNEQEPYLLASYEQDAILPHALGRFEDLLDAVAESPAMEMYLDNWESIGPDSLAAMRARGLAARPTHAQRTRMNGAPGFVVGANGKVAQRLPKGINENYGRELMELHTLGVGGGYTQQDVIEVAKCFTGWTVDRPYAAGGMRMGGAKFETPQSQVRESGPFDKLREGSGAPGMVAGMMMDGGQPGEFVFQPNRHEPGAKVVLGHTIAEGGINEGLEVLHILATSPATAHFLSQELAVRFVSDNPPAALVNAMTATYMKSDGDIGAVLTTMFRSKVFWTPAVYRAKVKTPLEFLTSAVRASDATVTNPMALVQAMDRLGMPVWGMQTPNGYGWTAEDWVSSNGLLSRMNFALVLSGNRLPGTRTDWTAMLGRAEASAATEKELEGKVLDEAATARTRAAVMAEFANPAAQEQAEAGFAGRAFPGGADAGARLVRANAAAGAEERELDTMAGLLLGSPEFQRR
ncbi:MAG: DUF1800 domain-containing protein [Acidobacteriaceae bacterium]